MKLPFDADEDLLADIAKGDARAFEMLYRRYFSKVYGAAYKRLQDKTLSEEVVQEAFVSIWERRSTLKIEHFESYLNTTIKYLVIGQFRKNAQLEKYLIDLQDPVSNFTEENLAFNELNTAYELALGKIPDRCKEVFLLKRSGLSQRAISEKLDISEKTVENHMSKALKILKDALQEYTNPLSILLFSFFH